MAVNMNGVTHSVSQRMLQQRHNDRVAGCCRVMSWATLPLAAQQSLQCLPGTGSQLTRTCCTTGSFN
jgi:hypothetical protein